MAEAAVATPRIIERFYCHSCTTEITPDLPDYTCPQCDDGFVEQISDDESSISHSPHRNYQDGSDLFHQILGSITVPQFVHGNEDLNSESSSPEEGGVPTVISLRQNPHRVMIETRQPARLQMQGILSYFLSQLSQPETGMQMPGGGMFQLHGSPADYAWGAHGLDSIISQLLNQLEGSGAPPAPEEKISSLPLVKIDNCQVEKNLQCSVCMEDFKLDEEANKLPCEHHYHPPCIVPWLKLHGTCPVCRKDLNGEEVQVKDNYD